MGTIDLVRIALHKRACHDGHVVGTSVYRVVHTLGIKI